MFDYNSDLKEIFSDYYVAENYIKYLAKENFPDFYVEKIENTYQLRDNEYNNISEYGYVIEPKFIREDLP